MADEKGLEPKILRSPEEENTPVDTTSAEPLRKANVEEPDEKVTVEEPDPPRTTRGNFTSPKFGSAGSGGAELEPGPERN